MKLWSCYLLTLRLSSIQTEKDLQKFNNFENYGNVYADTPEDDMDLWYCGVNDMEIASYWECFSQVENVGLKKIKLML